MVGLLDAVPVLLAVHRPVPADDGGDPAEAVGEALRFNLPDVIRAAFRFFPAPAEHGVDEDVLDSLPSGEVHQGEKMPERSVGAEKGDDAHQVKFGSRVPGRPDGAEEGRVREERSVGDRPVDLDAVGIDAAAGADVEVAGLGIAHGSLRESHCLPGGGEQGMGNGLPEPVHIRRLRAGDEIARAGCGMAPAVENEEQKPASRLLP